MTRRYTPDPDAVTTALAARVDRLERDVHQSSTDLTALGRGVADLTAQIRSLTSTIGSTTGSAGGARQQQDAEDDDPQPDWIAVLDVETARTWLAAVADGVRDVLPQHGVTLAAPCWALHPGVVALLLAVQLERAAAYAQARPTAVTEWLTRWLPAAVARIDDALAACVAERGHREAGAVYDARDVDLASVATWWAADRHLPAARALALPRLS